MKNGYFTAKVGENETEHFFVFSVRRFPIYCRMFTRPEIKAAQKPTRSPITKVFCIVYTFNCFVFGRKTIWFDLRFSLFILYSIKNYTTKRAILYTCFVHFLSELK
jgi:hypothetical protein